MVTFDPDARRARIHARGASASGGSRPGAGTTFTVELPARPPTKGGHHQRHRAGLTG